MDGFNQDGLLPPNSNSVLEELERFIIVLSCKVLCSGQLCSVLKVFHFRGTLYTVVKVGPLQPSLCHVVFVFFPWVVVLFSEYCAVQKSLPAAVKLCPPKLSFFLFKRYCLLGDGSF